MERGQVFEKLRAYIDRMLETSDARNPVWNIEKVRSGEANKWNYIDGCMITAILALYAICGDKKYLNFADSFVGDYVNSDGSIDTYRKEEYNLDNINPGKNLFTLYELTGKEKYRSAIDTIYNQLLTMPRTNMGNFWHKKIYPNQVWLDGLYMAQPFYMEYEVKYNGMKNFIDIFHQFENVRKWMRDEKTGLYYHGYDESRQMYWANPETGCSSCFWLRALGWFMIALVDTIDQMDEQMYYEYRTLGDMLRELMDALLPYQDKNGMFYQLPDRGGESGNYLEASGTAIIAYGILKAVRLGISPQRYRKYGEAAFYGTAQHYLREEADGQLVMGGICLVAGLGGTSKRDGTPAYYYSEPIVENEAKGVAPLLLAYTEILRG